MTKLPRPLATGDDRQRVTARSMSTMVVVYRVRSYIRSRRIRSSDQPGIVRSTLIATDGSSRYEHTFPWRLTDPVAVEPTEEAGDVTFCDTDGTRITTHSRSTSATCPGRDLNPHST